MKFVNTVWRIGSKVTSVDQILEDRQIVPQTRKDLHDPFLLAGMRQAVDRIKLALTREERIWVYGDYDVDGITSCAILMKYFLSIGARASYYIPDRVSDGYGLSTAGIEEIASKGGSVIITVDCGINAFEEAAFAKQKGIDLIITDHHTVEDRLPDALAVINPKRGGYPFLHLAGCGVAFKLVQALAGENFDDIIDDIIDVTAIGTVADIVSLTGENRIIVSEGIRNIKNLGLKVLIRTAGKEVNRITTTDISFVIAPIINACGRIGNPKLGVELLLTDDSELALRMARKLYSLNQERQSQCKQATEESIRMVEQNIHLRATKVIAVCGEDWHSGIIGIVASKLVELYHRPAIVLTRADGQLKGSARSMNGVSIYSILNQVKHHLLRFGGHDMAAGLTLEESAFEAFYRDLQIAAKAFIDDRYVVEKRCDYLVTPDVITMQFISELDKIQPCGLDNHEPVFEMKGLNLANFSRVGGEQQHAKITVKAGMGTFDGIGFSMVDSFEGIRSGDDISILFSPEISRFRGTESISLKIKDVHSGNADFHRELKRAMDMQMADFIIHQSNFNFTSLPSFDRIKELNTVDVFTYEDMKKLQKWVYDHSVEHEILFGDEDFSDDSVLRIRFLPTPASGDLASGIAFLDYVPQREDVVKVFHYSKKSERLRLDTMSSALRINVPKVLVSLELLKEVGKLEYHIVNYYVTLSWKNPEKSKRLEETELFQKIQRETGIGGLLES